MKILIKSTMIFLLLISFCAQGQQLIDLTHPFNNSTLHWPTANPFRLIKDFAGTAPGGYFYAINDYTSAEHVGTHMDAPLHFAKGHEDVASVPLSDLVGRAVVLNVQNETAKNPDYQISVADFKQWEKKYGRIPDNSIVLLDTGFSNYWPNQKKYLGTTQLGAEGVANLHFPGLSAEAAKWLIQERKVKSIGIDTASIDYGQSKNFLSHQILTANNVPFFENVANLDSLPVKGFMIYALPMKISGGTGAPTRIIAVLG